MRDLKVAPGRPLCSRRRPVFMRAAARPHAALLHGVGAPRGARSWDAGITALVHKGRNWNLTPIPPEPNSPRARKLSMFRPSLAVQPPDFAAEAFCCRVCSREWVQLPKFINMGDDVAPGAASNLWVPIGASFAKALRGQALEP